MTEIVDRLRAALDGAEQIARAATEGPWWHDEDDNVWRLHGVAFRIPAQDMIPQQVVNKQILKAPKRGTAYTEYWPDAGDAAFILSNGPDVALRTIAAHRSILARHTPMKDNAAIGLGPGRTADMCSGCGNSWVRCPDVLAVASIYLPDTTVASP